MAVVIGDVERKSPMVFEVTVTGASREEILSFELQQELLKRIQMAGMPDPALEPGSGAIHFDEATSRFSKRYRFLGA